MQVELIWVRFRVFPQASVMMYAEEEAMVNVQGIILAGDARYSARCL
jgi:hypothetical protein